MPTDQGPFASAHLVQFRMSVRNMLPETLAAIHRSRRDPTVPTPYDAAAEEAQRIELDLVRTVALPGIPRRGEDVVANPNWEPVAVERVEWMLDPDAPDEAHVTVYLADLDEDEVGAEWGAVELLLDSGWSPRIDG